MPDVRIIPSQDGPYLVSGPARLTDAGGRELLHLNPGCERSAPGAGWQRNPAVDRARSSQPS
jgi:hypothetical protein